MDKRGRREEMRMGLVEAPGRSYRPFQHGVARHDDENRGAAGQLRLDDGFVPKMLHQLDLGRHFRRVDVDETGTLGKPRRQTR